MRKNLIAAFVSAIMLCGSLAFADDGTQDTTQTTADVSTTEPTVDTSVVVPVVVVAPEPVVTTPVPVVSEADEVKRLARIEHERKPADKHVPFKMGMSFDLSVPSITALGLEARLPYVPWFKFGLSGTMSLAPGIRANVLIDPIKFPIAPVLNVDIGHQFPFTIPSLSNSPSIDFTYYDFQGGLALGSRDGFRFMLMSGFSYIDGTAHNFSGILPSTKGLTVADPGVTGWIPNAKLGIEFLF